MPFETLIQSELLYWVQHLTATDERQALRVLAPQLKPSPFEPPMPTPALPTLTLQLTSKYFALHLSPSANEQIEYTSLTAHPSATEREHRQAILLKSVELVLFSQQRVQWTNHSLLARLVILLPKSIANHEQAIVEKFSYATKSN